MSQSAASIDAARDRADVPVACADKARFAVEARYLAANAANSESWKTARHAT
jgi:hypothetical protein